MPRQKVKNESQTTQVESSSASLTTKVFPITLYQVSREWIQNLYLEMKRTVMAKAIETDCPKEFLDHLNGLELLFSEGAEIRLSYQKGDVRDETVINEAVFKENLASQSSVVVPTDVPAESAPIETQSQDSVEVESPAAEVAEEAVQG